MNTNSRKNLARISLIIAFLLSFGLAACSADEEEGVEDSGANETAEGEQKIISLSPASTEILVELGVADSLIAVDSYSNYPPESIPEDTSFDAFTVDTEKILDLEPTLVVQGVEDPVVAETLEAAGIETIAHGIPVTMEDVYANIAELGVLVKQEDNAAELVADIRASVLTAASQIPEDNDIRVYHEVAGDNSGYYVASADFSGDVYTQLGVENIATPDALVENALSPEIILEKDPNVIVLSGDVSKKDELIEALSSREGWSEITAVKEQNIIVVDADSASRPGPRVKDFVQTVSRELVEQTSQQPVAAE